MTPGGTGSKRSGRCSAGRCWPSEATRSRPTASSPAGPSAPAADLDPDEPPDPARLAASDRELALLDQALEHAATLREANEPLYVLWHYPPFDQHRRPGPVVERLEAAGVTACVYGHIHIQGQWSLAVQGEVRGVRYHCVAADAIGFRPLRLDRPAMASHR